MQEKLENIFLWFFFHTILIFCLFFQMRKFYEDIEQKKEQELLQDMQNRKHHDTLLPTQKSPIPLNRYEVC